MRTCIGSAEVRSRARPDAPEIRELPQAPLNPQERYLAKPPPTEPVRLPQALECGQLGPSRQPKGSRSVSLHIAIGNG